MRYGTELVSFTQDAEGVSATIRERATGTSSTIRAAYLVACDGTNSRVRQALGVRTEGLGALNEHFTFVYFQADWGELVRGHKADAFLIERPEVQGFLLVFDEQRGLFSVTDVPKPEEAAPDYPVERGRDLVKQALGKPDLAVEILEIVQWQPMQQVAEQFQQGRVFLVGDAAHTMPPTIGGGAHSAILSAQNLGWKLAAALKGQASPDLLTTYHVERHPVGEFISVQSLAGPAMALLRQGSEQALLPPEKKLPLFYPIAGYRYRSAAILSEDVPPSKPGKIELLERQEFTGQPGSRVPHFWVERQGQRISTLDLLDGGFVLLTGAGGMAWSEAASAVAEQLGIRLSAYRIGVDGDVLDPEHQWPQTCGVEASGAVLVRPDGFVAWRSPTLSRTPAPLLEQVLTRILARSTQF